MLLIFKGLSKRRGYGGNNNKQLKTKKTKHILKLLFTYKIRCNVFYFTAICSAALIITMDIGTYNGKIPSHTSPQKHLTA